MPAQDKQEPKSNMSEAETAEKAEKRKAKKARQRAARAQAAAQTTEVGQREMQSHFAPCLAIYIKERYLQVFEGNIFNLMLSGIM